MNTYNINLEKRVIELEEIISKLQDENSQLNNEIDYLKNMLELESLRFKDSYGVEYDRVQ